MRGRATAPTRALYQRPTTARCTRSGAHRTAPRQISGRWPRAAQRGGAGLVLRGHHVHHHRDIRSVPPAQQPHNQASRRSRRGGRRRDATALPVMAGGHKVYGVFVSPGTGYRDDATTGVATQESQPQGAYMVASEPTHVNSGCCFDYGNAKNRTTSDNGNGHMGRGLLRHLVLSSPHATDPARGCRRTWKTALFGSAATATIPTTAGNKSAFVTALVKNNGTTTYAIKGGNADSGGLTTGTAVPCPPRAVTCRCTRGRDHPRGRRRQQQQLRRVLLRGRHDRRYPTDAADTASRPTSSRSVTRRRPEETGDRDIVAGDNSAKCVDDNNGSGTPGTKVQMWDCDGNTAAQNWTVNSNGTSRSPAAAWISPAPNPPTAL